MPQQFDFPKTPVQNLRFSPRTVYIVLGVLAALWLASGIYTVDPGREGGHSPLRQGAEGRRPGAALPPALADRDAHHPLGHAGVPRGDRLPHHPPRPPGALPPKRPNESLMLTGDLNIVNVELVVQYKVSSVVDALFQVNGLGAFEGGRRRPGARRLRGGPASGGGPPRHRRGPHGGQARGADSDQGTPPGVVPGPIGCGLTVESVQLQSVGPPEQVDAAFKDVASAKEDRERLVNEARGYQNDVIPEGPRRGRTHGQGGRGLRRGARAARPGRRRPLPARSTPST